jgi:large subunit ribosomal protein L29
MKTDEVRAISEKEREEKIDEINQEIFNLRLQLATGKIENPSRIRYLRRDVARIKTINKEAQVLVGLSEKQSMEDKAGSNK